MLRRTVPGTILLALACRGAPRGDDRTAAAAPAPPAAPDSLPCTASDRMPRVLLDTTREYTLRVVPPDSARRYSMREYRLPLCPRDPAR